MARGRKKAKRRSRPRGFRVLAGLESLAYASILSQGLMGTSVVGLFTGQADIRAPMNQAVQYVNKDGAITLSEIIATPDLAVMAIIDNAKNNLIPMSMAAIGTGVAFRVFKSVLRRPLSNVQRNLINPIVGKGLVRLV
tara:strand:- start:71 stop:484 length:414 start_codon:yes stop_codon:yes gene_type:complete